MVEETNYHEYEVTVRPVKGFFNLNLGEVWEFRELMFFLVWRGVAVKYKQTVMGVLWAIIQPVMAMIVFSVIFGRLAKLDSQGFPYEIFSYIGILPWQFFSSGVSNAAGSIVSANTTITKTYFPRLILPIAEIAGGLVDYAIAFVILLGMMVYYQIPFTWRVLTMPIWLGLSFLIALAVGLWLASWNVKYRDVKFLTGFIMQFWQYATPVAYSSQLIPGKYLWLYRLNPMATVIDGYRWAFLGTDLKQDMTVYLSFAIVILLFIGGVIYFQNMERNFADVV